jgi:DNA-directed RNA polymerase specialized sigma24 family protein
VETELDPIKQARHLIIEAALSMTKIGTKMRKACTLWYVDGLRPHQAAKVVNRPRQLVHRAIKTVKPHLAEVEAEVEKYGAKAG